MDHSSGLTPELQVLQGSNPVDLKSPDAGDQPVRYAFGVGDVSIEVLLEERILEEDPPDDKRGHDETESAAARNRAPVR